MQAGKDGGAVTLSRVVMYESFPTNNRSASFSNTTNGKNKINEILWAKMGVGTVGLNSQPPVIPPKLEKLAISVQGLPLE
jgi:hypothetical protein